MTIRSLSLSAVALWAAIASPFNPARAGSVTYEVLINTSDLVQGVGGLIDMQISPADPPGTPSVSAFVYLSSTDGTINAGPSAFDPAVGTAAGDLTSAAGVSMNNTEFSEIGQDFTIKSYFDILVTLSGSEIGLGASGPFSGTVFSLTLFDAANGIESTTFSVTPNIDGNGQPIIDGTIGISISDANVSVIQSNAVPEPSSLVPFVFGLGAVVAVRQIRERRGKPTLLTFRSALRSIK